MLRARETFMCCIIVLLLVALGATSVAQEASALASVAEVARALTDPARVEPVEMTFRGVVTFVSGEGVLCVQQETSGVLVDIDAEAGPLPQVGDEVEIQAVARFITTDAASSSVRATAHSWRIVGPGTLPEPERPWLLEALNGQRNRRWVEIEGVVMQMALDQGRVRLHLTDLSGWAVVTVERWVGAPPQNWWGAKLKITAANMGRGHEALQVATSSQITVVTPGVEDVFAAPTVEPSQLRGSPAQAERLRLEGTVLGSWGDYVYVRSTSDAAWRFSFLYPFVSTENPPHVLELIPPPRPELVPGDRVEVVGSALHTGSYLQLSFASVRQMGHEEVPAPLTVEGRAVADHLAMCQRVRLSGTVVEDIVAGSGRLRLDADGTVLEAILPPSEGGWPTWHVGDRIELVGILTPSESVSTPVLFVAAVADAQRLAAAPLTWKMSPAVLKLVSGLALGLLLALGGAWWLRRLVKQRTADLAASNLSLQQEIAARRQTEAELARALANERELGELKNRFVTMVSHEFRTPLGITMSAVELLRNYEDRLDPEQRRELLDDIHRSTRGMGGLMEQVLVLGRVGSDTAVCRRMPCDLDELAQKLTDESLSATNRRCPIVWQPEGSLAGAHADAGLLRHLFSNLLSNAVKYSPEGEPVIFTCRREGADAVFTVEDHGVGIPENEHARLFEAFHRCQNVTDIPGTGLGLVIVKRCVDLHGGQLSFVSAEGKGTTFTVRLPLWENAAEENGSV